MLDESCMDEEIMLSSTQLNALEKAKKKGWRVGQLEEAKNKFRGQFISLCLSKGYTKQKDLAQAINVSASVIRGVAYGERMPHADTLLDLGALLGDAEVMALLRQSPARRSEFEDRNKK